MTPDLFETLSVLAFSTVVFGAALAGVLSLPWSDSEIDETALALQNGWRRVDGVVSRWLHRPAAAVRPDPARRLDVSPDAPIG